MPAIMRLDEAPKKDNKAMGAQRIMANIIDILIRAQDQASDQIRK